MYDAVSYPRQVSHVAMPSSSLGPDSKGQTFRFLIGRSDETEKQGARILPGLGVRMGGGVAETLLKNYTIASLNGTRFIQIC